MKAMYALIAMLTLTAAAFAQPGPPPGEEGGGPGPRGGPPGQRGPGHGRPDGPPPPGDFEPGGRLGAVPVDSRMAKFEMMRSYFDAVDRYARLARDPSIAGVAAVVGAADILRPRGATEAIAYFEKVLPDAKSPAVQRAIRLQLIDLYKAAGKQDQALEQLKTLMSAEPGPNDMQAPAPPPPGSR